LVEDVQAEIFLFDCDSLAGVQELDGGSVVENSTGELITVLSVSDWFGEDVADDASKDLQRLHVKTYGFGDFRDGGVRSSVHHDYVRLQVQVLQSFVVDSSVDFPVDSKWNV
jgi:hypothetical protein